MCRFVFNKFVISLLVCLVFIGSAFPGEKCEGNIAPNFKIGFSERFRLVTRDNTTTLSEDSAAASAYTRHRTNLMGQWYPLDNLECALQLTNEFRYYFVPENREFDLNEIIINQLYLKWKSSGTVSGTLTLGRQNIILGEGFVVKEGHPLDGSRSIYFNAVRYDWGINQNRTLTLFYSYQPEIDDILPVINDQEKQLVKQAETGFGAYFTGDFNHVNLQSYFVLKKIESTDIEPAESKINTLGARTKFPIAERLSIAVEGAYQFGERSDDEQSAFGGYTHLDYKTGRISYCPQLLTIGAIYLSGDDYNTENCEGWDPLFGRWAKWSGSYIYTQIKEDGVAYWTNLISLYGKVQFAPAEDIELSFNYHHLMAARNSNQSNPFPGGTGKTRGDLFIAKLNFQINEHLSGHLLWESFRPGNYYFDNADSYGWTRIEFLFKL